MPNKDHWEQVYTSRPATSVSWFQPRAERSLRLIESTGVGHNAAIHDIGGGASTLVDDLLDAGYRNLTVLDISGQALAAARERLGMRACRVRWVEADITQADIAPNSVDLWHDRAVFHFLTSPADRAAYVRTVFRAVKPGGFVIVATFAEDGPEKCSGLEVVRYRPDTLHGEFGDAFTLVGHEHEAHQTPTGNEQAFVYCWCRKGG
jgi:ubiquinone/menaquinone biosynthesis C-methylase UbiE